MEPRYEGDHHTALSSREAYIWIIQSEIITCARAVIVLQPRLKYNYIAAPMKYQRVKGGRCSLLTRLAIMSTKLRIIPVILLRTRAFELYVSFFPREREFNLIPSLREGRCNSILNIYIWIFIIIVSYTRSYRDRLGEKEGISWSLSFETNMEER